CGKRASLRGGRRQRRVGQWSDVNTPPTIVPKVRVLKQLVPHEYERAKEVLLNDELGLLAGRCAPANPYPLFGRTRTWHGRLQSSNISSVASASETLFKT